MLLIGISCAWIAGIWLGSIFEIPVLLILSSVLPVPFLFILKNQRKHLILLILCLLFFFGGSWLYPVLSHQDNLISAYNDQGRIEFIGVISEPPEKRDNRSQIIISIKEVNGHSIYGKALYSTYSNIALKYGDSIIGQGFFQAPSSFTDFDYRAYLAGGGIYSTIQELDYRIIERDSGSPIMAWIFDTRERLAISLASALPEPQASLCQGIVLGIRTNIPQNLKFDLSVTGTAHLLAISGQNLTIITGLLLALGLFCFGRRYNVYVWLTLGIIWFYALFTGLQAPVIRSAIMASLFLLAEILGRQKNAFPALIFGAAIMIAISPRILGNLSFQLSFMAMAGLIFITPIFSNLGRKAIYSHLGDEGFWSKPLTVITDSFSVSLGAVIAIWPIISYTFGNISFIGPMATFLISPVLPPIIVFGSLTAITGLFSHALSQVIGWIAWLFLSYMVVIAGMFAVLPAAYLRNKPFDSIFLWLYYGFLLLLINIRAFFQKLRVDQVQKFRTSIMNWTESAGEVIGKRAKWIIPPLLITAILTSLAAVTMPESSLKVSFLDVGEGESILIQSGGQNILIDGGPSGQAVCSALGKKLPFWERKIDLVILTHPHLDHLTGLLEVLKRYDVEKVIDSPNISNLPPYQEWLNLIKSKNIEYITAQTGQKAILINGAVLEILSPPSSGNIDFKDDPDENAIVTRLTCGPHNLLFTSDIGSETETRLLRERLVKSSDILKIAHHGSDTSSSIAFLKAIHASSGVISVGAGNQFGHPAKATLERIAEAGIKVIYRTDINGTVTFNFDMDGSNILVITEH
jgi:competence protein ComEC